jgi:hypothetical protein
MYSCFTKVVASYRPLIFLIVATFSLVLPDNRIMENIPISKLIVAGVVIVVLILKWKFPRLRLRKRNWKDFR